MDKLVSVIIRTCNRPHVLENALESVRKQTHKKIEIVVVEDGINLSEKMIKQKFADLDIKYRATNKKCGRTVTGNIGLQMASGQYLNFLDDDDVLYPRHIEILLKELEKGPFLAAYSIAEESQIVKISDKPYKVKEKRRIIRYKQPFNALLLYSFNYLPIQSVLFKRCLYEKCGGFDEKLDVLEDWDLWVRYSTKGAFSFVPEITSKYHVPFRGKNKEKRNKEFDRALKLLYDKFKTYKVETTAYKLHEEMDYVINVYNQKTVIYYLKMVWNYFVYGER